MLMHQINAENAANSSGPSAPLPGGPEVFTAGLRCVRTSGTCVREGACLWMMSAARVEGPVCVLFQSCTPPPAPARGRGGGARFSGQEQELEAPLQQKLRWNRRSCPNGSPAPSPSASHPHARPQDRSHPPSGGPVRHTPGLGSVVCVHVAFPGPVNVDDVIL